MKGKALRRALATRDALRVTGDVPLILDTTELVTPELAREMLTHNKQNRPIHWRQVEEYADAMRRGDWKLHAQGIVFDNAGQLLTGQTRLWAVIYADVGVYMRISRGSPPESATLLDRGRPQSARDLATRQSSAKHSPIEQSIARGVHFLQSADAPTKDALAALMVTHAPRVAVMLQETAGTKKTKGMLFVLAAICAAARTREQARALAGQAERLVATLEHDLAPATTGQCWGRGVAFRMALRKALSVVEGAMLTTTGGG